MIYLLTIRSELSRTEKIQMHNCYDTKTDINLFADSGKIVVSIVSTKQQQCKIPHGVLIQFFNLNTSLGLLQFVPAVFNSSCLVRAPFCAYLCNCVTQLKSIISVTVLLEFDKVGRPSLMVICGIRGRLVFGLCLYLSLGWCLFGGFVLLVDLGCSAYDRGKLGILIFTSFITYLIVVILVVSLFFSFQFFIF
ncbi:Hypothetical_protein [Hexamita inflata]|uniref:Hypothetical_protein n=1 Tax=Hexamita inflata TaxID=28002 RepID=A0AA86UFL5_9EUKA|nr:Hypothetical protein HINF_LOCUS26478 [Hexamita inflata]